MDALEDKECLDGGEGLPLSRVGNSVEIGISRHPLQQPNSLSTFRSLFWLQTEERDQTRLYDLMRDMIYRIRQER